MKKLILLLSIVSFVILVKLVFFFPANKDTRLKLRMIEDEVSKRGYKTNWIVISGKRSVWYNRLLSNSVDNSNHLQGNAVDIYVFDIDGNNNFNQKDIEILRSATQYVENNYPRLKGAFGTYTNKGYFSRNMVHLDVRSRSVNYNK